MMECYLFEPASPLEFDAKGRTMPIKISVFSLAPLLFSLAAWQPQSVCAQEPQEDQPESSPLKVTTDFSLSHSPDCKAGEGLQVQLHYTGAQPLRGYVVKFSFADPQSGKPLQQQTLQEVRTPREPMIASGAEWTRVVCTIPKKISRDRSTVTASVDALKFANDSIWGPAALHESHEMIGTLDGMDFLEKSTELQRFVSPILPQQGPFPVAGVESQTLGPLKIESGLWRDEHGQELLAVAVTNVSATPIRGYLFTTSFFDPATGDRIRRFSTKELETRGNPADYLAPGSTWIADPRKFSHLADGTPASYTMTLDLVVFADGSTFGPIKSSESYEVLGMIQGIDDLKRVTEQGSASKLR
jgi:hypothetical protein